MKIRFESPDVPPRTVEVFGGLTLMEAAVRGGIDEIEAECGGAISCGTCHVYIPEAWREATGEAGELEVEILEMVEDRRPCSRLSCQITLTEALDGLVVELPSRQ